jgi:Rap1a immunity proteins
MKRLCLLAFLLWPIAANAEGMTLLQLNDICSSNDERDQAGCTGFMAGFFAGLIAGQIAAKDKKTICFPDKFTPPQLNLILKKIVRDGPQFLNLEAVPALTLPLQIAYPCRRSN